MTNISSTNGRGFFYNTQKQHNILKRRAGKGKISRAFSQLMLGSTNIHKSQQTLKN